MKQVTPCLRSSAAAKVAETLAALERRLVRIHAVEQKRLRIGLVGEPARQRKGGMQVTVDETRRRYRAAAIDYVPSGKASGDHRRLVDGDNAPVIHRDRRVADDAAELLFAGAVMSPGGRYDVLLDHDAADVVAAEAQAELAGLQALRHPGRLDI